MRNISWLLWSFLLITLSSCVKNKLLHIDPLDVLHYTINTAYNNGSLILLFPTSPELYMQDSIMFSPREVLIVREELVENDGFLKYEINKLTERESEVRFVSFDLPTYSVELKKSLRSDVKFVSNDFEMNEYPKAFGVVEFYNPVCALIDDKEYWASGIGVDGGDLFGDWNKTYIFVREGGRLLYLK